ncbi:TetR/AcrR family transcriptional regulator [Paraglaciecola sp.]|uniref:TetR/AcrR family transcriptional regulator n=1 Tax=Paraglaciecola sp. TaxID=1920173 RepID=UPI00273FE71C|nr:TetR/AcrR family transcriptional regulator [Paraglaciecola sp.]MDP5031786.1 TetR/AcrR family transcriptional regulator [Paraglaciecola sp.]
MSTKRPIKQVDQLGREVVLTSAARLFRDQGYERTTVKEVAKACNMLPGSLHYRYQTKEAILVDLMRLGLERATLAVTEACVNVSDPVEQLRRSINAHLKMLVTGSDMVYVLLFEWRSLRGAARKEMIELRDRYEALWGAMLSLLAQKGAIRKDVDLNLLRLIGLGALNWVATWFNENGRYSLEDIGDFVWLVINSVLVVPSEKS